MADVTFTIKLQGADSGGSAAVKKVVDALKALGIEATIATAKTKQIGAAGELGAAGMARAVGALKALLGGLSLAFAVHQFKELALAQLSNAAAVGRLSQALGIGTEALSVFQFAAHDANVESETLAAAFRNLATAQQAAKNPASAQALALKSLGIAAKDIVGLPLDKFMLRVADAASQFAASGQKLTAVGTLIGPRVVTPMIPLLQKLANDGFAKATAEAKKFGLVVSEESAKKAADFEDALTRLQGSVHGLAGAFATGFAPAVTEALDALVVGFEEGGDAAKDFGADAGTVFKTLIGATIFWVTMLKDVWDVLKGAGATLRGDVAGAGAAWTRILERNAAAARELENLLPDPASRATITKAKVTEEITALENQIRQVVKSKGGKPEAFADLTGFTDVGLRAFRSALKRKLALLRGDINLTDPAGVKAAHDAGVARTEALVEGLQAGIAAQKAAFDIEQQQADEHYRAGIISAKAFFDDRRRAIETAADDELVALRKVRDAIAKRPVADAAEAAKRAADVAKVDDQIAARRVQLTKDKLDLDNKEAASAEELAKARLDFEGKLLEAQGRTADAALLALRAQLVEQKKLLVRGGATPEEADAQLAALQTAAEAKIKLDDLTAQAGIVFSGLETRIAGVNALVAAGVISATEGERQVLELQKGRLPVLDGIRAGLVALQSTIKDPAALDALRALVGQIDALHIATTRSLGLMADFKRGLVEAVPSVVTDQLNLLGAILSGTAENIHSVGDAFKALALTAVNALQQIIIQLIAVQAQKAIAGLFAPVALAEQGGVVTVAASGGYVMGPRHRHGGKRIEVEGGEYIFDRGSVQRFGADRMRALHRYLQGGALRPALRGQARYESGGLVERASDRSGTGSGLSGDLGLLRVGLADGLVGELLQSPAARRAIVKIVREHPRTTGRG